MAEHGLTTTADQVIPMRYAQSYNWEYPTAVRYLPYTATGEQAIRQRDMPKVETQKTSALRYV